MSPKEWLNAKEQNTMAKKSYSDKAMYIKELEREVLRYMRIANERANKIDELEKIIHEQSSN